MARIPLPERPGVSRSTAAPKQSAEAYIAPIREATRALSTAANVVGDIAQQRIDIEKEANAAKLKVEQEATKANNKIVESDWRSRGRAGVDSALGALDEFPSDPNAGREAAMDRVEMPLKDFDKYLQSNPMDEQVAATIRQDLIEKRREAIVDIDQKFYKTTNDALVDRYSSEYEQSAEDGDMDGVDAALDVLVESGNKTPEQAKTMRKDAMAKGLSNQYRTNLGMASELNNLQAIEEIGSSAAEDDLLSKTAKESIKYEAFAKAARIRRSQGVLANSVAEGRASVSDIELAMQNGLIDEAEGDTYFAALASIEERGEMKDGHKMDMKYGPAKVFADELSTDFLTGRMKVKDMQRLGKRLDSFDNPITRSELTGIMLRTMSVSQNQSESWRLDIAEDLSDDAKVAYGELMTGAAAMIPDDIIELRGSSEWISSLDESMRVQFGGKTPTPEELKTFTDGKAQELAALVVTQKASEQPKIYEKTATNPKTGAKMGFINGEWEVIK
jgi:hypothetical protein